MRKAKKRSKQPSQVPPLDDRHYLAIRLLFKRKLSRSEIAQKCGISRMQLYRWEQRKDFQREYDKLVAEYSREMGRKLKRRTSLADMALAGDYKALTTIMNALI